MKYDLEMLTWHGSKWGERSRKCNHRKNEKYYCSSSIDSVAKNEIKMGYSVVCAESKQEIRKNGKEQKVSRNVIRGAGQGRRSGKQRSGAIWPCKGQKRHHTRITRMCRDPPRGRAWLTLRLRRLGMYLAAPTQLRIQILS